MHIAPHSSMAMEGELQPSQVQLRVNSRQWRKVVNVHSMEIDPSFTSKVEHREVKHFKEWFPWLIPFFVIANVIVFIITMYVNDCPNISTTCIAPFLGRFLLSAFQWEPSFGAFIIHVSCCFNSSSAVENYFLSDHVTDKFILSHSHIST